MFTRSGNDQERSLLDDNEWALLDSFHQDVELIGKKLAAQSYVVKALQKINLTCNAEGFEILTSKIPFYQDFQEVALVLKQVRKFIHPKSNVDWTYFENSTDVLGELDKNLVNLEYCDFSALEKVQNEFSPTGTYQELSLSNGWDETYLEIAKRFDELYKNILEKKFTSKGFKTTPRKTLLQRIFKF